jgi:hypothetical protein
MATEEAELARIEEHLLWCEKCIHEAEKAAAYADAIRAAIIAENFSHEPAARSHSPLTNIA